MAMNLDQSADTITPSTGGLSVAGLIANPTTIATNYTIPTGYNAMTAGKVTVNTGVTVTVSTGSRWVVV